MPSSRTDEDAGSGRLELQDATQDARALCTPNQRNRPLRVVIPESIPTRNRGEAAILEGIRHALSFCGRHDLTVYSPRSRIQDDRDYANGTYHVVGGLDLFDVGGTGVHVSISLGRARFFRRWTAILLFSLVYRASRRIVAALIKDPLLQAIGDADLIVAGHDGMLTPDHFYLGLSARIMNKPLALYGGSHGMQGRKGFRVRKYLQYLIRNALLCTVRDQRAKDFFVENGVPQQQVQVFPDPAVLLQPCEEDRAREILESEGIQNLENEPLYCLIPVRGGIVAQTSFTEEADPARKHQLRVELWKDIVVHLLETTNARFLFLPHCTGPTAANDDRRMNHDICEAISGSRDRLTVIDTMYRACELKGIMRLSDFVLGERTHALIGAVSVATPCVALTTQEDLRMHCVIKDSFGRPTYNLNNPNMCELKDLLTVEWNQRHATAPSMRRKGAEIHRDAIAAAELLARKVDEALRVVDLE